MMTTPVFQASHSVTNFNSSIKNVTIVEGNDVVPSQQSPTSIKQMRQPMSYVTETEKFKLIHEKVKNKLIEILQCYGVHGSGKSQIVLQLGDKFPYLEVENQSQLFVKWHIQCGDSVDDVKEELKKLTEELQRKGFISSDKVYSICDGLDKDIAETLVQELLRCKTHVLLIVEDPKNFSKKLLKDLGRSLKANDTQQQENNDAQQENFKFHLYMTCRSEDQIFTKDEKKLLLSEMVKGFNENEAVDFLKEVSGCVTDTDAASKIVSRFSGLPLGLQAARGFCRESQITYDQYLELVQHNEVVLEMQEKEMIENEYGESAEHVFQAIVMPFLPSSGAARENKLHWDILSCLSYFHHDRVPVILLERCCYMFSDASFRALDINVKVAKGQLKTKLESFGMCIVLNQDEVLFHQVVLNAFRVKHKALNQKLFYLKKAIEVLCSLVSKDLRQKSSSLKMSSFLPHLQSLLGYVGSFYHTFERDSDFRLYKALLSHLYEVMATIMSGLGPSYSINEESNQIFYKALNLLWEESEQFIKHDPESNKFVPAATESELERLAEKIVDLSRSKGELLPENFVLKYASKLYYCYDINELKVICENEDQFSDIKAVFDVHDLKEDLIMKLYNCGLFLDSDDYGSVFHAERLATIFHSWSRAVLYASPEKIRGDKKSEWLSSLGRHVSLQCKLKFGVHLLNEWIAMTAGLIPIWLKQRGEGYLEKVLRLCENALLTQDTMQMYENGLKKETIDPQQHKFSRMSILRGFVRANARLGNLNERDDRTEKDGKCAELVELSQENSFSNSGSCMIYCAKYYAARKHFRLSMNCFRIFFHMMEGQKVKFMTKGWVAYNYARAIYASPDATDEDGADAIRKCEEVLNANDVMTEDLNSRINRFLELLKAERQSTQS